MLLQTRRIFSNLCCHRFVGYFAPENILKEEIRTTTITNYKKIKPLNTELGFPTAKAAILIPICVIGGETCLLYTVRTAHLSSHKGQVSFPGGKHDNNDMSLEYTALRETQEELGIDIKDVKIWGAGSTIANRRNLILPVIGQITKELDIKKLNISSYEVEEVFTVSLENLCNESTHAYTQFKAGYIIPVFKGGPKRIWGITAMITHMFLKSLVPENMYHHKLKFVQYR